MAEIFEEYSIAGITVGNRIVAGPIGRGLAGDDGSIPDELLDIYSQLAHGGAGMLIGEMTLVSKHDYGLPGFPFLILSSDAHLDDYRRLADMVHAFGVPIVPQIGVLAYHRRMSDGRLWQTTVDELTHEEIAGIITDFATAAYRAKSCGFDGVELHAAHGFLLAHFLSPVYNHRRDEYGGSAANRARIVGSIVQAIRERCGDFPILAKGNCNEGQPATLGYEDALKACHELASAGVETIDVSALGSMPTGIRPGKGEGCFAPFAKLLKDELEVPVMLTGGHRSMAHMQHLLTDKVCDLFVMARPLIREPGIPARWASGDTTPSDCKSCNLCSMQSGCRCYFGTRQ